MSTLTRIVLATSTSFLTAAVAQAGEVLVSADIAQSTVWTADNTYNLQGQIYVLPGASLTIEAGTIVASDTSAGGSLAVAKGAQIFVLGTKEDPVIMTSKADVATWTQGKPKTGTWREAAGEWGNLSVMGNAYVSEDATVGNTPVPSALNVAAMEGLIPDFPGDDRVLYGGGDDEDDSGVIAYLSLRYGGQVIALGNELNGLSLGGVGRGTDIHHVDVMNNLDDGIEIFGGTVDLKYFNIWNVGDDSLDVDQGWRGRAQFGLLVQGYCLDAAQGSGVGDNCFELDGAENSDWQPVTTAAIYNCTVVGQPLDGDHGTAWRDNARVQFRSSIFMDLGSELVRFDNSDGGGGNGYGFNNTLTWQQTWNTDFNVFSAIHPPMAPLTSAELYPAQTSGRLAEIKDSVFFRNLAPNAYVEANAVGVFNPACENVLIPGTNDADAPIKLLVRGPIVPKGGKLMVPVEKIDPRPSNEALDATLMAPPDGFYTPHPYRGAFWSSENWVLGWTAADAFGFVVAPHPASPVVLSAQVPAAWQAVPLFWARDQHPVNRIDDFIDDDGVGPFEVIVAYRQGITTTDLALLASLGTVERIGRYLTYVSVSGLDYGEALLLAQEPSVAFIERQFGFNPSEDVSVPALKVTASAAYSPDTVEDAFPGIDGSGIHIAIVDSGVDNVLHESFAATPFIGGYNALTGTFEDPDDDQSHGTLVASIALGQATALYPTAYPTVGVARGVAPGASLIDVKVFDNTVNPLTCSDGAATWNNIMDGLETLIEQHQLWMAGDPSGWRVDVINMSLRQCAADMAGCTVPSDGIDAFSQMVDLASALGIVVVAAAGNDGDAGGACFLEGLSDPSCFRHTDGPSTPGAASRAITVGATWDNTVLGMETIDRSDDTFACFTTGGPRLSDGDVDLRDDLKPDVAAPGYNIHSALYNSTNLGLQVALGTSMAAPHVAGLAALVLEQKPGMTPGQVKDLLISTAEALDPPTNLDVDPIWNDRTGWGLVDAFEALSKVAETDLTFPHHPANPGWASVDLSTSDVPAMVGEPTLVTAMIENLGPVPALGVHVLFGVHVYSASTPVFHDIGTQIVDLPLGVTPVSIEWTPADASHQCLKVEIAYGADIDPTNNTANRNLNVAGSPVEFQVANDVSADPILIGFEAYSQTEDLTGWDIFFTPETVLLSPADGPATVQVLAVPPIFSPPNTSAVIDVGAIVMSGPLRGELLGGITFFVMKEDCNGNGLDDSFELGMGMAQDCDGDGVIDSCAIRAGLVQDCNGNSIPDACDIGVTSRDVNGDGVPDECPTDGTGIFIGPLLKQH